LAALGLLLLASRCEADRISEREMTKQKGNSMIAKVIQMLGEENDKIKADLEVESKTMAEYMQWCDDTQTEKSYAIKTANTKIEDLSAIIEDNGAQIEGLDAEIAELGNEISERQTDIDDATAIRNKEKSEFLVAEEEQVAMVQELEDMEVALKQQMAAMTTPPPVPVEGEEAEAAPALLQTGSKHNRHEMDVVTLAKMKRAMTLMVNSVWVDPESKKNLALMQSAQDPEAADGPASDDENLAAFEGLKGKAEESLQRQRDEEVKKQNEHNLNVVSLKQAIALAEEKVDDAKRDKNRLAEEKAKAEDELGEVKASKAADEKTLAAVTQECNDGAAAWDNRQKEAKAEMAAIDKAKEILASRVTVLLQVSAPVGQSLKAQVKIAKTRQKLISHFRTLGNKLHSLAMLNLVSVATSDPMEQVKTLLNDLIEKLMKEAAEAASLHQFCSEEKAKTAAAKEKKDNTLAKLDARLDKASTKKEQLAGDIATLSSELAEITKVNAESTKIRNEEHTNFLKVEADFTEGADAVDDAIDALKEYYGDTSLLQTGSKSASDSDAPPALGGAKSDSAGGIVGMLETMGEEFRHTVKTAQSEERESQKAYDTLTQDNKVATAAKEAEVKGAESEIKSLSVSLHDFGQDRKMAQKELDAINEYVDKLKPQCEGRVVPYAERKAKREAEIQGLKEALSILEEESPAGAFNFLQTKLQRHY